jgi:hypothetical protein
VICTVTLVVFALTCCGVSLKLEAALSTLATVPLSDPDPVELQAARTPPSRNSKASSAAIILGRARALCDRNIDSPLLP